MPRMFWASIAGTFTARFLFRGGLSLFQADTSPSYVTDYPTYGLILLLGLLMGAISGGFIHLVRLMARWRVAITQKGQSDLLRRTELLREKGTRSLLREEDPLAGSGDDDDDGNNGSTDASSTEAVDDDDAVVDIHASPGAGTDNDVDSASADGNEEEFAVGDGNDLRRRRTTRRRRSGGVTEEKEAQLRDCAGEVGGGGDVETPEDSGLGSLPLGDSSSSDSQHLRRSRARRQACSCCSVRLCWRNADWRCGCCCMSDRYQVVWRCVLLVLVTVVLEAAGSVFFAAAGAPTLATYNGSTTLFVNELFTFEPNDTYTAADNFVVAVSGTFVPMGVFFASATVKLLITAVAISLPIPAGLFSPVFLLGALFGRLFGSLAQALVATGGADPWVVFSLGPADFAIMGAAAFAGGVTRAISTVVIVMELTGQLYLQLPVAVCVLAAYFTANRIAPSVYEVIAAVSMLPDLPRVDDSIGDRSVSDAMTEVHAASVLCAHEGVTIVSGMDG